MLLMSTPGWNWCESVPLTLFPFLIYATNAFCSCFDESLISEELVSSSITQQTWERNALSRSVQMHGDECGNE